MRRYAASELKKQKTRGQDEKSARKFPEEIFYVEKVLSMRT